MQFDQPHEKPSRSLQVQLRRQRGNRAQEISAFDHCAQEVHEANEAYRQATGKMARLKTRLAPIVPRQDQATGPIRLPQPNPVTPWHCVSSYHIADTPTIYMETVKKPAIQEVSSVSMKSMHDSDIPPEQEMVFISNGKWHFDSPAHMPDRATLNIVIERYYQGFRQYPTKFEVSEGFFANLCLFNIPYEDIYYYKDADGKTHPVQIVPNFWVPFWCISAHIPSISNHN